MTYVITWYRIFIVDLARFTNVAFHASDYKARFWVETIVRMTCTKFLCTRNINHI